MSHEVAWYFQPLHHDFDTSHRMMNVARELGHEVVCKSYPGFDGLDWRSILPRDKPVLFQGSIGALQSAQKLFSWPNGTLVSWADWRKLSVSHYISYWGDAMLSQRYGFYPLSEVKRLKRKLWDLYANCDDQVFIRPDTNDKVFCGGVVHLKNLGGWLSQIETKDADPTLLCFIAEPSTILAEYRLVVCDGKVIASSRYRLEDRLDFEAGAPQQVISLAERAADAWSPHRIFVLDIAEVQYGSILREPRIVECGSVNVAGFYKCELRPIVEAMVRVANEGEA